jgi:hypothetical protein
MLRTLVSFQDGATLEKDGKTKEVKQHREKSVNGID